MSRLLSLSPAVIFPRCKYCPRNSGSLSSWSATGVKQESQLQAGRATPRRTLTLTRPGVHSNNGGKRRFWALGIGTGFLLALGLKCHVYSRERCDCECEKTVKCDSSSKYRAAIEISRDLLQRIKVQVSSHQPYYITLYYITIYYITPYCITLYCITLYCITLYCITIYYITLLYYSILYYSVLY